MDSIYTDMTNLEKQVAKYLRELDLWWVYEFPVFVYDEKKRPRVWTPDFYIPKLGMHIEVSGSKAFDYEYREKIYKKNGYHVIFLHLYKEKKKWKKYLVKRIMEIEEFRHSEVMKMINSVIQARTYTVIIEKKAEQLENKNLVGRCGIYCGSCIIYRAYKDSEQLRQRVAERENCEPKDVRCEGCQTVLTNGWDRDKQWGKNCRIVTCLETKGLVFCYECDIYPNCEKFGELANHLLRYSESLTENLKKIEAGKVEEWLKEEREKWKCHKCGKPISRHLKECHWCGKKLEK